MKTSGSVILLLITVLLFWNICSCVAQTKAPGFTLADINGVSFSLSNYRGKVVILDFFDTMCSGCIAQFEHLKALYSRYPDQLALISISVSPEYDTNERLRSFAQQHDMQWIVARDTVGISNDYNIRILPTLTTIDVDGYIKSSHEVSVDWAALTVEIDNLLSDTEKSDSEPRQPYEMIVLILAIGLPLMVAGAILLKRRKHL